MPADISELVVKLKPEGASETREELEKTSEEFEESADTVDEESSNLQDFAQKFKGAMSVVIGGLAVATGGLLTRVPVIQETMAGLEAVLTSIGLAIDEELRGKLSDVNSDLFDFADNIDKARRKTTDLESSLESLTEGTALQIAVSVSFDVLQALQQTVGDIQVSDIRAILRTLFPAALGTFLIAELFKNAGSALEGVLNGFINTIREFVDVAKAVIFTGFQTGFELVVATVKNAINSVISTVETGVNESIKALNKLPEFDIKQANLGRIEGRSISAVRERGRQRLERRTRQARGAAVRREGGTSTESEQAKDVKRLVRAMLSGKMQTSVNLDGREVAKVVQPFLDEGVGDRGRPPR